MISILMPIYNGIEFINDSVSSILEQTYDKWELLIGINGHPENSEIYQLAKNFEEKNTKIKVFDFYNIKGKSNTLNELIKHCKYNYVALLDVDDIWNPEKLEVQSFWLNDYDVIGSNCVWFGDRPGIVPSIPQYDFSNYNFANVNPIINSSVIIRKELCYWNENGIEDYDLWLRLRKQNKRFYNCPQILVKHRIHSTSAFNAKGNNNKVPDLLKSHGY
jgi:glycosyltransferase involved in cell wall biosynthesis